jgi:glycosyltransferase involved in cell wall biosynthesis
MPSIYYPPRVGGIESHVYYLARELARRGHTVEVITTRTERTSPRDEMMDGVRVKRLPSFGKNFMGWTMSSAASVPEVLRRSRVHDIVHCHTFAFALGGAFAARLRGSPLVVTVHSSHFLKLSRRGPMRSLFSGILRPASALLSTSEEIDGVVRSLVPGRFTMPIVNGIDTGTFRPVDPAIARGPDEFLVVCPRRLVEKNGVEYLVRALPRLEGKLEVRVCMAGDGPLRAYLEGLATRLGVRERIEFMGSVPNTGMPGIYSSADLVVIPSLIEATSIAALEAMSCERVVAASRVGGLPEIVDEATGILFDSGSPQAVADAILEASARPDMAEMGRRARSRVEENWSIRSMTDTHEEIYRRVLEGCRSA